MKNFKKKSPLTILLAVIIYVIYAVFFPESELKDKQNQTKQQQTQPNQSSLSNVQTYDDAKRALTQLYRNHPTQPEFYCGCQFTFGRNGVDKTSCQYQTRADEAKSQRVNWEHVVTASHFGRSFQCWDEGGRKACQQTAEFERLEGDMHNLQPAIEEINYDRSNFKFTEFKPKKSPVYGQCESIPDFNTRFFEPRKEIRGAIARTYLYMADRYPEHIQLRGKELSLMKNWNSRYPVTKWECQRNKLIEKIQGNDNPFITEKCEIASK